MYTLDDLKKQNQEISDLIDVLEALVKDNSLISNPFVCELATRFNEKVWMHLVFEDKTIYSELCRHHNPDVASIAKSFHDSSRKIKKLFSGYVKLWCHTSTKDGSHDAFIEESNKIFGLIRERIQFESKEIFPIVEKHYDS
jgi:hemerythrin-like domain-containing protein